VHLVRVEVHLEVLELVVVDRVPHVAVDQRLDREARYPLGANDHLARRQLL